MMRTILFGVDGLTFRVLHPLMERGALPHFQRLREQGCEAILASRYPPLTPPAWVSLFTGLKPARHGIYDYWSYETQGPGQTPRVSVNTRRKDGKAIWNILSEYGKRVLIINVPMTYPPEPVNGIMISGYLTPDHCNDFTYPPTFKETLQQIVPNYSIDLDLHDIFNGKPREEMTRLIKATLHMTRQRITLLHHLLQTQPWDFCFVAFVGADRLQHPLWEDILSLDSAALDYYRLLDDCLGQLLSQLTPHDNLLVVSDHGFQGVDRSFAINEYLYSKHLLTLDARAQRARTSASYLYTLKHLLKQTPLFPLAHQVHMALKETGLARTALPDVLQPIQPGIDWQRTYACVPSYSCFPGGYADIFLNTAMDQQQIEDLCEDLHRLVDPLTHTPLLANSYTHAIFGRGPYERTEPHLLLLPSDGITFTTHMGNHRLWNDAHMEHFPNKRCGVHHTQGVLYAYGGSFKRGLQATTAEIYDIVPTILQSMGIHTSDTFDGCILHDLFAAQNSTHTQQSSSIVQQKIKKIQKNSL